MGQCRVRLFVDTDGALGASVDDGAFVMDIGRSWDVGDWCRWFDGQSPNKVTLVVDGFESTRATARLRSSTWAGIIVAIVYALEGARLSGVRVDLGQSEEFVSVLGPWDMDAAPPAALDEIGSYVCMCLAALFQTYATSSES